MQALAFEKLHDDISRVVFLEVVAHTDDVRFIQKLSQHLRLRDEFRLTKRKRALRARIHGVHRCLRRAGDAACREIFLYRDLSTQLEIVPDIGDAESALAYRLAYDIAPVEDSIGRQLMRLVLYGSISTAVWTAYSAVLHLGHAIGAEHRHILTRSLFYVQYVTFTDSMTLSEPRRTMPLLPTFRLSPGMSFLPSERYVP